MDSIVATCVKFLSNPQCQPLLENLRKQNDEFLLTESSKLLMEDAVSSDEDEVQPDDEEEEGATDKEIAMGVLNKIAKLFEYTSILDKGILFVGFIFTIIHAACFPMMAILFGKISNAYIAHTLLVRLLYAHMHQAQLNINSD